MQIAERILKIEASQSLVMAARAKAMAAAGIDVVSMSLGEPDMDTPKPVRLAAQEAVDNHWSHYGPVAGIPALREAVAKYQNGIEGNAIHWCAEDVLVSAGAKMAIYDAIQAIINPGDEVVIPMPSWVSYSEMVKLAEGVVVPVETKFENRYCLTPEELRKALTPKTRMIILCSPNNPTGSVYSAAELEEYFILLAVITAFVIPMLITANGLFDELAKESAQKYFRRFELSIASGYVGYFVLGHYLNTYQLSSALKRMIFLMGLLSVILVIVLTHWYSHSIGEPSEVFYSNHNLFLLFESMTVFLMIKQLKVPANYSSLIVRLSNLTLGVYLIHPLLYLMANDLLGINGMSFNPYLFIPCYSLILFVASCLVVFLLKKIPIIKRFLM